MRRVSFFVQQGTDGHLDRARGWLALGWLDKVYLQLHGNVDSTISLNRRMWAEWQRVLGRERVYAWFWGSPDSGVDADLVRDLREEFDPAGWCANDEIPTHFVDRSAMLDACETDPIVASCAGYPEIIPSDFRHYAQYGAAVEWQCYDGEGVNHDNFDPGLIVPAMFRPGRVILRDPDNPAAWWYRVYFDNLATGVKRWAWAQFVSWDGVGTLSLREGRNTWAVRAREHEYGFVLVDRIVLHRKTGRKVGIVFGTVQYPRIRVALSVERPTTGAALAEKVRRARVEGASIRGITLYTLDNARDDHVSAIVSI